MSSHKMMHYYLYPILVSLILYLGLLSSLIVFSQNIMHWVFRGRIPDKIPNYDGLGSIGRFISDISLYGVAAFIFSLLVMVLAGKFSKYIVLIVLSPVFALLSEKVEEHITGKSYPFSFIQFLKDILRGIVMAIRNLIIELSWLGVISLVSLFSPMIALISFVIMLLISSYFYGFSMIDYINERKRMSIKESVRDIRKHKGFAIGNGLMYWLIDMIPGIGMVIGPINGVVGAVTGKIELEQ
ncbi:MAG: EI24 domain-containing protein [Bacteroidia bacterium]|nr:EI24 domain-containing protein [Bacteroidia bacterium]